MRVAPSPVAGILIMCAFLYEGREETLLILYFDGLCEPVNPGGVATYGYLILDGRRTVEEGCGFVGAGMFGNDVSNNVAEYTAMIRGIERLLLLGLSGEVAVRGDSQLVINQMLGRYAVRAERILPLHNRAVEMSKQFGKISFEWIPREMNAAADALTRKAFSQFLEKNGQSYKSYYGKKG